MSKNVIININNNGTYEEIYPKTYWSNIINRPTIPTVPSLPLSVSNGGTGVTSVSALVSLIENNMSSSSGTVNKINATIPAYNAGDMTINFPYQPYFFIMIPNSGPFLLWSKNRSSGTELTWGDTTVRAHTSFNYTMSGNYTVIIKADTWGQYATRGACVIYYLSF